MYSNCGEGEAAFRSDVISTLTSEAKLSVHNYGECGRNKDGPASTYSRDDSTIKLELMAEYQFTLSFDNTVEEWNQSEKLWHALLMGNIPIYWGAPVKHLLPCTDCIIDLHDFMDGGKTKEQAVEGLVDFLLKLFDDDARIQKYLKWREQYNLQEFLQGGKFHNFQLLHNQSFESMHCGFLAGVSPSACVAYCDDDCRKKNGNGLAMVDLTKVVGESPRL